MGVRLLVNQNQCLVKHRERTQILYFARCGVIDWFLLRWLQNWKLSPTQFTPTRPRRFRRVGVRRVNCCLDPTKLSSIFGTHLPWATVLRRRESNSLRRRRCDAPRKVYAVTTCSCCHFIYCLLKRGVWFMPAIKSVPATFPQKVEPVCAENVKNVFKIITSTSVIRKQT